MLEQALIHADWDFALWAVLMLLAAMGFWADRTKLGSTVSGVVIIIALSMLLSNTDVLPKSADVYGVVWSYFVPLAIPLLLLKADLRRVLSETKGMLLAFSLGAFGTTLGALLGFYLLPLGIEGAKLAGVFSATYIGGSMNMVAVTQAVELDSSIVAASVAADNVVGVVYLVFLISVPTISFFQWWFKPGEVSASSGDSLDVQAVKDIRQTEEVPFKPAHIALALGLSFAICAAGKALAEFYGVAGYSIMFITALVLVIANLFPKQLKALRGDYELGQLAMYVFFVAVGVSADVSAMFGNAMVIAAYALLIIVCHTAILFGLGRFFKLDLMETAIASNACVMGPATAAAQAAGKGRRDLVAPAVLIGVFGYAVANFVGIGLTTFLTL